MLRIPSLPETPILLPPKLPPDIILVTDASDFATGGFVTYDEGQWLDEPCCARTGVTVPLTMKQAATGSACRELVGAAVVLQRHDKRCRGKVVEIRTDAAAALQIFDNGGSQCRSPQGDLHLHEAVLRLECVARRAGVTALSLNWFPRDEPDQALADALSKVRERGDWWLTRPLFAEVTRRLGPCVVDCFADEHSNQLQDFHSRGALVAVCIPF